MNNPLPPPIPPAQPLSATRATSNTFARQAAMFSLAAPVAAFSVGVLVRPQIRGIPAAMMVCGLVQMLLIVAGFVLGIVAWVATKRCGREGVFGKAVAGTCINGLLVLLIALTLPVVMKAAKRAKEAQRPPATVSLGDARRGFATKLLKQERSGEPAPAPPAKLFRLVKYQSQLGPMSAYVSPSPTNGKRHPAIIWIVGGFGNSIDAIAWHSFPPENDQSGSAFREAGILMMYASLRGGNDNPGVNEGFFGEVDDILAAADYLTSLDYVDSERLYLGGHSTGGTLALLVAESSPRFRAVFCFGPVQDARSYGADHLPFNVRDRKEGQLRAPGLWLHSIHSPTFMLEGATGRSNIGELNAMQKLNQNPFVHFHPVKGLNHFSILAPITRLAAAKILRDEGASSNIAFSNEELNRATETMR